MKLGILGRVSILEKPAISKVTLENGMTLIVKENHAAPLVAIDAWVRAGAMNEGDENNGISHFFEHMLFKGTEKRKAGEISLEIESVGGYSNAATSKDYTHYYVVVPSEHFDLALDVLADVIMNPAFDREEIERERKVILEEKRRSMDNPRASVFNLLYEIAYLEHPYRRTVLGTMESISGIERGDFFAYHREYYAPNNMAVIVVGDVSRDEVISKARLAFKDFERRALPEQEYPKEGEQEGVRRKTIEKDVEQSYLAIAFHGPSGEHEDGYALDVLATILGSGRSSRLYQRLKEEKRLVTDVDAFFLTQKEPGLFFVFATLKEENLGIVEVEIIAEISNLVREPATEEELERAKTFLTTDYAYETETNRDQAEAMGYYETIAGDYGLALDYPKMVRKVSSRDVQRVAERYLSGGDYSIAIVKPEGG